MELRRCRRCHRLRCRIRDGERNRLNGGCRMGGREWGSLVASPPIARRLGNGTTEGMNERTNRISNLLKERNVQGRKDGVDAQRSLQYTIFAFASAVASWLVGLLIYYLSLYISVFFICLSIICPLLCCSPLFLLPPCCFPAHFTLQRNTTTPIQCL